jgi:hypothetical protein
MKPIDGYFVIKPDDLDWRPSNLMKIPNADFLERWIELSELDEANALGDRVPPCMGMTASVSFANASRVSAPFASRNPVMG